ncbi:MAG: SPOR domain-containing protein [Duodenibacillus sp.]
MRAFVNVVLLLAIAAVGCYIAVFDEYFAHEVEVREQISVKLIGSDALLRASREKEEENVGGVSGPDLTCFVWGPFSDKALLQVRGMLEEHRLLERAEIVDRFLPDRWIIYLGRFHTDTAVRAFMKQFRQQGMKNVRAIVRGDLAYGVEIASFDSQKEAQAFLESQKMPDVKGLRVTNRLGEPSDSVDLVFNHLSDEERGILFSLWPKRPGTQLQSCTFYPGRVSSAQ